MNLVFIANEIQTNFKEYLFICRAVLGPYLNFQIYQILYILRVRAGGRREMVCIARQLFINQRNLQEPRVDTSGDGTTTSCQACLAGRYSEYGSCEACPPGKHQDG